MYWVELKPRMWCIVFITYTYPIPFSSASVLKKKCVDASRIDGLSNRSANKAHVESPHPKTVMYLIQTTYTLVYKSLFIGSMPAIVEQIWTLVFLRAYVKCYSCWSGLVTKYACHYRNDVAGRDALEEIQTQNETLNEKMTVDKKGKYNNSESNLETLFIIAST